MIPLILREGAPPREVHLDDRIASALATSGVAKVIPSPSPSQWLVSAGTKVGAVRVGDLQVVIEPKIPIQRLMFLMGYARKPSFWQDDPVELDPEATMTEALAGLFLRLSKRALDQGTLKGYVTVDESAAVLRGRVRYADQLKRHFGRTIPLEVRFDDFTVDIAENQLLLAATEVVLRMPRLARKTRAALLRQRLQLNDVTSLVRGTRRPAWSPNRLNARYQPALYVAELILDGNSFEQEIGGVTVRGFVLNMWRVFEDFVCVALREALAPQPGCGRLQYKMTLDTAGRVDLRPDFVWLDHGAPRIVADAKYKAENVTKSDKKSGFPQADLYQMLAYCTVLGLPDGHLIYAKGEVPERVHRVLRSPVSIHHHTLDLLLPPSELLREMAAIAGRLHDDSSRPSQVVTMAGPFC